MIRKPARVLAHGRKPLLSRGDADVSVGALGSEDQTITIPGWAIPTAIGAIAGAGITAIAGGSVGFAVAMAAAGASAGLLYSQMQNPSTQVLQCPDVSSAAFVATLTAIRNGTEDATTATNLAESYDNGGCADAAAAVRAAMPPPPPPAPPAPPPPPAITTPSSLAVNPSGATAIPASKGFPSFHVRPS